MEFMHKLLFLLLSILIWTVAAALLAYPIKVIWNHSLLGVHHADCVQSFCTLLLKGYVVIFLRRPSPPTAKPRE